ncbi:MAG: hypothetical protein SGJ23_14730, partial [Alphaproteobacteria bacterium]|nr:hypothetical protein [Alphaproteobacteria bacterium]
MSETPAPPVIYVDADACPVKEEIRGADRRRVPRKQAQLDCVVRGVRSSTLFWRKAPGQGT